MVTGQAKSSLSAMYRDTVASMARREQVAADHQLLSASKPGLRQWDASTQLGQETRDDTLGKAPLESLQEMTSDSKPLPLKTKQVIGQHVLLENPELRRVHSPASMGGLVSSAASDIACQG